MGITPELAAGIGLVALGVILARLRRGISRHVAAWYRKIGVDIPEDTYAKQFVFIGVMLGILGFLVASGLIQHI